MEFALLIPVLRLPMLHSGSPLPGSLNSHLSNKESTANHRVVALGYHVHHPGSPMSGGGVTESRCASASTWQSA
ncbi:hypothetical protein F7725_018889 [Dissostichus mawsoni]|uniref:Uncharacterized protein n=1 Tax=Dissostichus mawsoni TaxID=36200 RepID=A0A7J5XSW3_DISMA|nr:hypothetical protein F7725_018889 [Dissostichus mawsoni]